MPCPYSIFSPAICICSSWLIGGHSFAATSLR